MSEKELPTIPQNDSETEYWKERAKSYERTIVALQKGIAEQTAIKHNGEMECPNCGALFYEIPTIESMLEEIKTEIYNTIFFNQGTEYADGLEMALQIIDRHIGDKKC